MFLLKVVCSEGRPALFGQFCEDLRGMASGLIGSEHFLRVSLGTQLCFVGSSGGAVC